MKSVSSFYQHCWTSRAPTRGWSWHPVRSIGLPKSCVFCFSLFFRQPLTLKVRFLNRNALVKDILLNTKNIDTNICCLCGNPIDSNSVSPEDALSMDHVPPKQFYPKELRIDQNLNLWKAPTHKRCNNDYRKDEEYFYHAIYGIVQKNNPQMGQTILRDLARRTHKPQTPAMIRSILKTFTTVTVGGIHLPPGIVQFDLDPCRSRRVVIKIAQGLFYLDRCVYMPRENCKDIRLCLEESDVPEFYSLSWQGANTKMVCQDVFSYRRFEFDNLHLFTLLFWESLMFCCAFKDPLKCEE